MRQTVGELAFTRSGFTVTVTDVPMSVCDSCGEQYVPGPLGVELSDLVEEMMNRIEDAAGGTDSAARPRSLVLQASRLAKPVPVP